MSKTPVIRLFAVFCFGLALAAPEGLIVPAAWSAPLPPPPAPKAGLPTAPTAAPASPAEPQATPADFAREVKLLFRVAACGDDSPLPEGIDAATVAEHCAWLKPRIERYRKSYLGKLTPFMAQIRPAGLPSTVVYPFGGGDLLSALNTYPEAQEYTTLSLELVGDPRRIDGISKERLAASLKDLRSAIAGLLVQNDSTSDNLMKVQRGDIPGQLGFFLVALAIHGQQPVGLRYFEVENNGTLHFLTAEEMARLESKTAKPRKGSWTRPDFSEAFSNAELTFRPAGGEGPVRVHRHIAANLADGPLTKNPGVLLHLKAKGSFAAMTKAASYLLWRPDFSQIRNLLLDQLALMISDSTGIPPRWAKEAHLTQETYGRFSGSFLDADAGINEQFRALWKSQPYRPLPFRYGYLDSAKTFHMLVTRRGDAPQGK